MEAGADFPTEETVVETRNLGLHYSGGPLVLDQVDIKVCRGEIVCIIGPSGCGKSTLLNLIAGTVAVTAGEILCFGRPITGLNRHVTYMTQKDTLLPWRTALDNAALPLEIKRVPKQERHRQAREAMERVGIADGENRRPHELSGGMRSRVMLARALLSDAEIMLMDEPFAAVDALRRLRLQQLLLEVWQMTHRTIMYVTHDLNEAIGLGHRVIVLSSNPGTIILERSIAVRQPRDLGQFQSTPEAERLHRQLWNALQEQDSQG